MRMKDKQRTVFLCVRVDDILFLGKPEDVKWFKETAGSSLTMKADGPHGQGSGGFFHYLKKSRYLPKVFWFGQTTPTSRSWFRCWTSVEDVARDFLTTQLSSRTMPSWILRKNDYKVNKQFRSALGLILYIAQDRPDIQFPTKILATYMAHPCVKALAAVKHLAPYLAGTETSGILLRRCEPYDTVFDKWNESEVVEPDYRRGWSFITMDVFSDSSWGDERPTRKSTTAGMIFMNGCLIHSICSAQARIALSSSEAELYAANSTMIESTYLYQLIQQLWDKGCFWIRLQQSLWRRDLELEGSIMWASNTWFSNCLGFFLRPQSSYTDQSCRPQHKEVIPWTEKLPSHFGRLVSSSFEHSRGWTDFEYQKGRKNCDNKIGASNASFSCYPTSRVLSRDRQWTTWWTSATRYAPEQGHAHGWYYIDFEVYIVAFVLVIIVVVSTCSYYPGRTLGSGRGGGQRGGQASSSSRRAPGDGGREGRSRTAKWRDDWWSATSTTGVDVHDCGWRQLYSERKSDRVWDQPTRPSSTCWQQQGAWTTATTSR